MLKCGQKNNTKYTFGLRKEQVEQELVSHNSGYTCPKCGTWFPEKIKYCSNCGAKIL
jgi:DNA-directed RNA polymerase subunit RPC12/RpoP